jgi:hypothetical protein
MSEFSEFSKLVNASYSRLAQAELFTVGSDNKAFSEAYLAAFPPGTDPIYKTQTEHNCNCCKNFVRNLGNVVAIVDGKMYTVWDDAAGKAPYPYDVVATAMAVFVRSQPITRVFRSGEVKYGSEHTMQHLEGGNVKKWNHFSGMVNKRHFTKEVGTVVGQFNTGKQLLERGMTEFTSEALESIRELIESKALYRGEEHRASVSAFSKAFHEYHELSTSEKALYLWSNATAPFARFKNTVIGTLVQDVSEGKELEKAVKSFEDKVAPENYKRPTALVTPGMVKAAMETITELGLEPSLERRFAKISDVSVNNVLWVNNSTKGKMKGGIESLLLDSIVAKPIKDIKAEDISIDDFMEKVLPTTTGIDMLVKNAHSVNFMSLTAPVHEDSHRLFKWSNDFAWSYDGNIADSLRQRVAAAGGRVDGVLRFSHSWNYEPAMRNVSLMDLHVFIPGSGPHRDGNHDSYPFGPRVGWNCRNDSSTRGVQDVDYTEVAPENYIPVENITFPSLNRLPEGKYTFKVHNWALRQPTKGGFRAEIEFEGQVFEYEHRKPLSQKEWVTVAEATLKNGKFSIEHKTPLSTSSRDKWGVKTETFVKVNTLMHSPNYWDDNAVGNKHWFFILEGCKNEEATRGIYNEFLSSELDKHRRVFELLGAKTKCAPSDEQLSGLGFSSTQGAEVTVKVSGSKFNKIFNIKF